MSCGIVLLLSDDLLNKITASLTKQEFSTIGYYYSYGKQVRVEVTDPFGGNLYGCTTLEELVSCPFVRRICLRPIKKEYEARFRMALAKVKFRSLKNEKDMLYSLFGFPTCSESGSSSLERIDSILTRMGNALPQVNINTLYGSGYESFVSPPSREKGVQAKVQILTYLASSLNQQTAPEITTDGKRLPAQIQSYVLDETIFGEMEVIKRECSSDLNVLREVYERQLPLFRRLCNSFVDLLSDTGFMFLVARGSRNQNVKLSKECLEEVFNLCVEAVSHLPQSKYASLHSELQLQASKVSSLLEKNTLLPPSGEQTQASPISSLEKIIGECLQGQPLDVNKLTEIYSDLSGQRIKMPSGTHRIRGEYHFSPAQVGIVLKSGSRVNLSLSCEDFSNFNYETLMEILVALDNLSEERIYDELRTKIAQELASYN